MSVRMTHPESGGEYPADPGQVEHLKRAGWQVAEGEDTSEVEEWPAELRRFGGQEAVELYHPVTGASYTSPKSAVPEWRSKGWLVVGSDDHKAAIAAQAEFQVEAKTVEQLKEQIRELNQSRPDDDQLAVSGTKAELQERIQRVQDQDQAGDQPAGPSEEES